MRLDRLRPREQADRAGGGEESSSCCATPGLICDRARDTQLQRAICALTAITANSGMCVSCAVQPRDAAQAEARAEAVDQVREVGLVIGRREAGLLRVAALGDERGEPHHVVAEARIDLVADHVEPFGEQPRDARGVAQRLAGAGLDAKHFPVGAEQRDLQQPRAFAALRQQRATAVSPSFSMVPSTSRSSAIGSAKRCSASAAGTGRRGVIGSSSRPSA